MTSGQKIAFSLLITLLLFAGLGFVTYGKLIPDLETNYYEHAKIVEKTEQLNKIAESCDLYISNILNLLQDGDDSYLKSSAVMSYLSQNPSEKDVIDRRKLTENLFLSIPSIDGIRLIDKNGRNVHFSTYDLTDIFKQSGISKVYKNYTDIQRDTFELDFSKLQLDAKNPKYKILLDSERRRIVISMPFYWGGNVFAGCMVFYINVTSLENALVDSGVISLGCNVTMISDYDSMKGGFAIGVPAHSRKDFILPVSNFWKTKTFKQGEYSSPERILQIDDNSYWVVLGADSHYFKIAGVYSSNDFLLSRQFIYIVYFCAFLTMLLIVYLVFSIKADSMVTLKKRIKAIQYSIVKEYIDNKEDVDWNKVILQLKSRKNDLSADIIKSLNIHSKKKQKELDELLEKNWDEIFAITGGNNAGKKIEPSAETTSEPSEDNISNSYLLGEMRRMMEEVLHNTKLNVQQIPVSSSPKVQPVSKNNTADDVEEIEEAEAVEEIDEAEEIEEAEAVEEIDEAEEIEEAEAVEEIDEAEEIEEAEAVEEIDEAEEIEEAEAVEEIDEAEEIEEAEAVEEIDETEDVEEAETVEENDAVEEPAEAIEDITETVEESEEPAEEIAEAVEEPEDVIEESAETVEEIEETVEEPVEESFEESDGTVSQDVAEEVSEEVVDSVEESADNEEKNSEKIAEDTEEIYEQAEDNTSENFDGEAIDETESVEEIEETEAAEDVEDIEEIEEIEEYIPAEPKSEEAFMSAMMPPSPRVYDYVPANDTYLDTDLFPTTDNLFGEKLELGEQCSPNMNNKSEYYEFTVYPLDFPLNDGDNVNNEIVVEEKVAVAEAIADEEIAADDNLESEEQKEETEQLNEEEVDDLGEEIPESDAKPYYSMTNFASNVDTIEALEGTSSESIIENDGVYSIAKDIKYSNVVQDSAFKALVDSVLH